MLKIWAPEYADRTPDATLSQAVAQARDFDLIFAKSSTFAPYVAAMKAANPNLKLLAYVNGVMSRTTDVVPWPGSAYAQSAAGDLIYSNRFGNILMEPSSTAWRSDRASTCAALLVTSLYDGCGLDVLGPASVVPPFGPDGYVTDQPVNPNTGAAYKVKDWLTQTSAVGARVRNRTKSLTLGNGLTNGTRYFDKTAPTSMLYDGVDIGMVEGFIRGGRAPIDQPMYFKSWKADVDMVVDAQANGHQIVTTTKTFCDGTQAQKDRWHALALASFMLAANGKAYFSFQYDEALDPGTYQPWWDVALGSPQGAYVVEPSGIFDRRFANGYAVVNPTSAPLTFTVPSDHRSLNGNVGRSFTLAPWSGDLLVSA